MSSQRNSSNKVPLPTSGCNFCGFHFCLLKRDFPSEYPLKQKIGWQSIGKKVSQIDMTLIPKNEIKKYKFGIRITSRKKGGFTTKASTRKRKQKYFEIQKESLTWFMDSTHKPHYFEFRSNIRQKLPTPKGDGTTFQSHVVYLYFWPC